MKIGGFLKYSMIDYPGNISSVVFTCGCNFRCGYCHNPELVIPNYLKKEEYISEKSVFDYILKNKNMLDAVVISGGEPCLQKDIISFISEIKKNGFKIKLDTNGTFPDVLDELISCNLLDYIAMDIKSVINVDKYEQIINVGTNESLINNVLKSKDIIISSGLPHEFRTTLIKEKHNIADIINIAKDLQGSDKYCLQQYYNNTVLKEEFKKYNSYKAEELKLIYEDLKQYVNKIVIRN